LSRLNAITNRAKGTGNMPDNTNSRFTILFALSLAALIWALATVTAQVRFPVGNDAIGYMNEAANLLQGKGLTRVVNETESPDLDFAPTRYQPPGFALAVAGISGLGLSVENAAVGFSRLSWALLPVALLFAMRPILPFAWAAAVTTLVILSPGIYLYGSTINTDVPTLLLVVVATGLMIRGVAERPHVAFLVAAGLIFGLAYALRNSVTAAFVGVLATFISASVLRQMRISSAMRNCAWIFLGSAPFIGLLLLRN